MIPINGFALDSITDVLAFIRVITSMKIVSVFGDQNLAVSVQLSVFIIIYFNLSR